MDASPAILVVDDEEDIRQLLALALRRAGFRAQTAAGPLEALSMLEQAAYALVITDLRMPGMDGLELLRRVADRYPATKGIVLTGYGSIQGAVEATKLGADNYITKPVIMDDLLRVVRTTLQRGQSLRSTPAQALEVSTLAALTRLLAQPSLEMEQLAGGSVDVVASMLGGHASLVVNEAGTGREIARATRGGPPGAAELLTVSGSGPRTSGGHVLRAALVPGGRGRHSGCLEVWRPAEAPPFSREEASLLQLAADQIAIALDNLLTGHSLDVTLRELREASLQTVRALVRAVEMRDRYTAGHAARVSRYAVALARSLRFDASEVENLRIAALLHDVGKVGISDLLLNKPGPLTSAERAIIEQHPQMGCQIIMGVESLGAALPLVLHHHERYDGLGYPDRLAGEQVPHGARILAVADSFEAMTADRAYRRARSVEEALAILSEGASQEWDPLLVARWRQIAGRTLVAKEPDDTPPQAS